MHNKIKFQGMHHQAGPAGKKKLKCQQKKNGHLRDYRYNFNSDSS